MLEELREVVKRQQENMKHRGYCNPQDKIDDELILATAQLILDSKGWPEKQDTGESHQNHSDECPRCAEIGGFNNALSFCLAAYAKEKAELIEKIPSVEEIMKELKNIGEYWTICKQDAGRELLVVPMGKEAIKIKAQAIHSELMKRLKDE